MPRQPRPVRPEINLAPLIDVTLVMLIILMVSVPLQLGHMRVKLPSQPPPPPVDKPDPPTVIAVYPHRSCDEPPCLAVDRQLVSHEELAPALATALRTDARRRVLVDAASEVPLSAVVDAMDAAKQAGALRIGLARVDDDGPAAPQSVD